MRTEPQGPQGRTAVATLEEYLKSVEGRAFRMARFATGDVQEALDIVQDAMLAFVRRYRSKPREQWPPLFYRTVDNRIKDFHRRRAVRWRWRVWPSSHDDRDPVQTAPDPHGREPDHALSDGEFGEALEAALAALPDRQRQAFLLRTWEGLSVAETAAAMGCGEGSVKTHLSRAMKTLRERLGEHR